ncbi:MAG: matrixin family metalloprotease [Curtobacterium sp.]
MPVRTTPWTAAATALVALAALIVTAAPAAATTSTSGAACPSGVLSVRTLQSGCTTSGGTVRLSDGRTFAVPARGESVVALSVAVPGAAEAPEVVVTNTGRNGVAVRLGESWEGAPSAVRQQRTSGSATTSATTTAAASTKCTSTANTRNSYRWSGTVRWYHNATGAPTSAQAALQRAANAWTGTISSCSRTVTSTAADAYAGTTTQAYNVTIKGGCSANNGSSVVGWGYLPVGTLGVTCVWYDQNGVAKEADQRYNTKYSWSTASTCSGTRYDVQAVGTHEWGHLYGLGHVATGTGQVMEPSMGPCALGSRTLGRGDMVGIAAKY